MMTISAIAIKGFLLSLSLCLDIGIVNTALINTSVHGGARPAFLLGLGSCLGDLVYAAICVLGLALVFDILAVRWAVWIGGGIVLTWLCLQMSRTTIREWRTRHAIRQHSDDGVVDPERSLQHQFLRGIAMALASPSSIVWFAAVGGSVIARSTDGHAMSNIVFLVGFFAGGLAWSLALVILASAGGRLAGDRLKLYCSAVSALLFAYFAFDVVLGGFHTLL